MQKKRRKDNKAITLIALVITVIVLLILAGVTMAALSGDNGILTNATKAKEQTEISNEKDAVSLAVGGALAEDKGNSITYDNLVKEFDQNPGSGKYTLDGSGPFTVTFTKSGRSYLIDENGNISEYVNISKYVKVGDYVNYTPDDVTTPYDKFGETYSGYANENIGQDDTLKWRVLNINTDGTVDLISDKPTSTRVTFKGARGYNNGVYLLNDYCKTMYSNSSKGAIARSVNIEDIQDKMKVDETTGKKAYENYTSVRAGAKYGEKYSYSSTKWYPLQWKNDNGVIDESKQETVTSYSSEDEAKAQETESDLTLTQTYWILPLSIIKSNLIPADTRDASKANSMYYELLCDDVYWLASRFVDADYSHYAKFGLRTMHMAYEFGIDLFASADYTYHNYSSVRPMVSLNSSVIDTNTDYETEGCWNLK